MEVERCQVPMVKAAEWQGMVALVVFVMQKLKDDFSSYEHLNCNVV